MHPDTSYQNKAREEGEGTGKLVEVMHTSHACRVVDKKKAEEEGTGTHAKRRGGEGGRRKGRELSCRCSGPVSSPWTEFSTSPIREGSGSGSAQPPILFSSPYHVRVSNVPFPTRLRPKMPVQTNRGGWYVCFVSLYIPLLSMSSRGGRAG